MFSTRYITRSLAHRRGLVVRTIVPTRPKQKIPSSSLRQQTTSFSSLIQHVPWPLTSRQDDRNNGPSALYKPPFIQILPLNRRFLATTTKEDDDKKSDEKKDPLRKRIADRADQLKDDYKRKAGEIREDFKHRAGEIRVSSEREWKEFREHPAASAKKGAISFGTMIQQYGPVFVGTYAAVYFTTLGALFVGIQSGLLDPSYLFSWLGGAGDGAGVATETKSTVDYVVDFMNSHSWLEPYSEYIEKNPAFANLAVAWIAVKFTEPIRFAAAAALTPRVARYFGRTPSANKPADTDGKGGKKPDHAASKTATQDDVKKTKD